MKSSLCLSTVAIALAWVLPAEAASSTSGPSVPLQQFAACAVQKYEGAEMLATQPGSDEESEVLAEFARKGCTAPSSDMQTLRGALAERNERLLLVYEALTGQRLGNGRQRSDCRTCAPRARSRDS